jgi:hypothetical protein
MTKSANIILQKLFMIPDLGEYCLSAKENEFLVIPGNGSPRWLVPSSSEYGLNVLADWNPYGVNSRIKWLILKFFYRFNLLAGIPGITKVAHEEFSVSPDVKKCQPQESKIIVIPVIYVGTPGPKQKIVVTLVEVQSQQAVTVVKIALGKQAKISIMQEAYMLTQLAKFGVQSVPRLVPGSVAQQTILRGKLSSRRFGKAHIEFLLSLPKVGGKSTFLEKKQELLVLYSGLKTGFTFLQMKSIASAINAIISKNSIELVFIHGDFAPWNIKQTSNYDCKVFDWEDARVDGLPLWDICHFNLIQAHLFKESKDISTFFDGIASNRNTLIESYLTQMNISPADVIQLALLYFLFTIFDENTNFEYKEFLIKQIPSVFKTEIN